MPRSFLTSWLAQRLQRHTFDNRRFWNERYAVDPDKGSGPGSRGEFLRLKNELIRSVIDEHKVTSILDIGCGDIAALQSISVERYCGIDISDVVIARNGLACPHWKFLCEDLTGDYVPEPAEFVLCLDVLIHQKSFQDYSSILSKSLNAAKKIALISGYSSADPGWNVFFHEPITHSIRRLRPQARRVKQLAEYRGTDLFAVEM